MYSEYKGEGLLENYILLYYCDGQGGGSFSHSGGGGLGEGFVSLWQRIGRRVWIYCFSGFSGKLPRTFQWFDVSLALTLNVKEVFKYTGC